MSISDPDLVAPFPWFGGKRRVAADIWARLGNVDNYVEPFFGSGAVMLARPHTARVETINDADHYVTNFWRAVQAAPGEVATWADWIVSEADLQTRHAWLVTVGRDRIAACGTDAAHYDAQVAGWWLWGICSWIGGGWCSGDGPWTVQDGKWVGRAESEPAEGRGISRRVPHVGSAGQGINRKLPHGSGRTTYITGWITDLASRLRGTRIACGDWTRVCSPTVAWKHGLTGVFLDPPYGVDDRATVYSHDCRHIAAQVRGWAIDARRRDDKRIAFAGYDGEHAFPDDWTIQKWKAHGGMGNLGDGDGRINSSRETLWFSPACLAAPQPDLFAPTPSADAYDRDLRQMFAESP